MSVLPLALYCVFGGLFLLVFAALVGTSKYVHIGEFPFIPTMAVKRLLFAGIGVYFLPIGVGLIYRRQWALWGFMAYIALCTVYVLVAWAAGEVPRGWNGWMIAASVAFNLLLAWGILHCTRPVFTGECSRRV